MIRQAAHDDLPTLLDMGAAMAAESPRFSRLRFSRERLNETLRRVLATEDGFLWVAEHEGKITGVMACLTSEHWMSYDAIAVDLALYVSQDARGAADARELVRRFKAWSGETGAMWPQVGVSAGINDEAAVRLYESEGFVKCGYILEAFNVRRP